MSQSKFGKTSLFLKIDNTDIKESTHIYLQKRIFSMDKKVYDINYTRKNVLCWWCCVFVAEKSERGLIWGLGETLRDFEYVCVLLCVCAHMHISLRCSQLVVLVWAGRLVRGPRFRHPRPPTCPRHGGSDSRLPTIPTIDERCDDEQQRRGLRRIHCAVLGRGADGVARGRWHGLDSSRRGCGRSARRAGAPTRRRAGGRGSAP